MSSSVVTAYGLAPSRAALQNLLALYLGLAHDSYVRPPRRNELPPKTRSPAGLLVKSQPIDPKKGFIRFFIPQHQRQPFPEAVEFAKTCLFSTRQHDKGTIPLSKDLPLCWKEMCDALSCRRMATDPEVKLEQVELILHCVLEDDDRIQISKSGVFDGSASQQISLPRRSNGVAATRVTGLRTRTRML